MKVKFFIVFILSIVLNYSNSSAEPTYYSKLLGKVRKENVEKYLLYLPERTSINFLQMFNQISSLKEKYSLTEVDLSYLIYKWIATNIKLELNGVNEDPAVVYNSGKGTSKGISSLFKNMCNYLRIEADTISGYIKLLSNDVTKEDLITKIDFTWNYVLIDGAYYLIDASSGAGLFIASEFESMYTDFFFGTNPEFFIRVHFPKDNKWQLLSEPYSLEKFESQAYLFQFFYLKGFKTISPDTKTIRGSGESKILLTNDESLDDELIVSLMMDPTNPDDSEMNEINVFDGKLEVKFNLINEKYKLLFLGIYDFSVDNIIPMVIYQLNPLK